MNSIVNFVELTTGPQSVVHEIESGTEGHDRGPCGATKGGTRSAPRLLRTPRNIQVGVGKGLPTTQPVRIQPGGLHQKSHRILMTATGQSGGQGIGLNDIFPFRLRSGDKLKVLPAQRRHLEGIAIHVAGRLDPQGDVLGPSGTVVHGDAVATVRPDRVSREGGAGE